ncbi:MAG: hypothetical protein P1U58_13175 [Verrucomicrobiales bacterium]|nr:hypothetical protein [Verrucomicrobiales bacterium]
MQRRNFLQGTAAALGAGAIHPSVLQSADPDISKFSEAYVPTRSITSGPEFHWFGYYDKLQFDPTNRFVLANQVNFEHRTPTEFDRIKVGMIDLENNDEWIEVGKSEAWGWQQGCMLQWLPGSSSNVIWNDRDSDQFVCRVHDVKTGETNTIPRPIYALSPDGKWGISADFARIQNLRPGYGYQGVDDPVRNERAPESSGIWRVNIETGDSELIISLAQLAEIPFHGTPLTDQWNYVNHLLVSPDSKRFIFLHRWRAKGPDDSEFAVNNGFVTRMFTAAIDGSDLFEVDPSGFTSHFIWRDPEHICAWTKPEGMESAFYLFQDKTDQIKVVGREKMPDNGHNTYLPIGDGTQWILNDTYPRGVRRQQNPYVYHVPTDTRHDLGKFHLPGEYKGEWRCDTHPRSSNDGKTICIDSPHGGSGRQLWLLDISEIVES